MCLASKFPETSVLMKKQLAAEQYEQPDPVDGLRYKSTHGSKYIERRPGQSPHGCPWEREWKGKQGKRFSHFFAYTYINLF